jgi:cell division septation protein DedD
MSSENQSMQSEKLNAAIACLDLSLESELALYRHRLSQETVALAALPSAESESLALNSLGSTEGSSLLAQEEIHEDVPAEEDLTLADQGIATIEVDDDDTLPESYSAELTAQPKAFDQFLDPSIDDYLQSSETLLKHLNQPAEAEPAPIDKAETPPKRSWVVIGGMTLLILGLLALGGFLVMLALRWFSIKPTPNPQAQIQPSPLPTTSLSVGSTPSHTPLPSAAISSPLPSAATDGISPQPSSSASLGGVAATEGVPLTPSPSNTPTLPVNPNASRYIVLAIANSPESLQTAQRLVPDAYVVEVNGQKRIQLSALDSLQQAQQMVNELKNQGFPATIVAQN